MRKVGIVRAKRKIGPYSGSLALAKIDGRRKESKLLERVRSELIQHVGGNPTATQRAMIDRAAWLSLHIALMDARAIEEGSALSERDSRQYLAWSNSLTRTLRELGIGNPTTSKRKLDQILAERSAA